MAWYRNESTENCKYQVSVQRGPWVWARWAEQVPAWRTFGSLHVTSTRQWWAITPDARWWWWLYPARVTVGGLAHWLSRRRGAMSHGCWRSPCGSSPRGRHSRIHGYRMRRFVGGLSKLYYSARQENKTKKWSYIRQNWSSAGKIWKTKS